MLFAIMPFAALDVVEAIPELNLHEPEQADHVTQRSRGICRHLSFHDDRT
jgi:hypothetical protein